MSRELEHRRVEANRIASSLKDCTLEVVVEKYPRHASKTREGLCMPSPSLPAPVLPAGYEHANMQSLSAVAESQQ